MITKVNLKESLTKDLKQLSKLIKHPKHHNALAIKLIYKHLLSPYYVHRLMLSVKCQNCVIHSGCCNIKQRFKDHRTTQRTMDSCHFTGHRLEKN